MEEKTCSSCHNTFAPACDHFYKRPDKGTYRSHCKACFYKRARKYNAAYKRTDAYRARRSATADSEQQIERRRARDRARYIEGKFRHRIKRSVQACLKNGKCGRRLESVLGYTIDQLRDHLELQFTGRMSWDNYGTHWHIDHITPVSSFNFDSADDADFRACWALSNLRPMLARENIAKGNRRLLLI